jgi:MFS family permease
MSAFTAPALLMIPLAGLLSDRFGRKPVLEGGLLLFGVTGSAIAFTTEYMVVVGLRFCQGIGAAAIVPIIVSNIGDSYSGTRDTIAQGLRFSVSGVSNTVILIVASLLVLVWWRVPFLINLLAIVAAGPLLRWYTESTVRYVT